MRLRGHRFPSGLIIAPRTRWQLRLLRRAVRAGDWVDAVVAAAQIYNVAVRPSMDHGHWRRAHVTCERVLRRIPARGSPGYRRLRRVAGYFLASAAAAARADGDLVHSRQHLQDLMACLREARKDPERKTFSGLMIKLKPECPRPEN
ncbi:MAG TPA: hypothetical protein VHU92_01380 [Streptosporangiaceae bacterium]|jgi:hypothetical protein|nr:hypothetical protein [Streptosporangiaceae bacterium]